MEILERRLGGAACLVISGDLLRDSTSTHRSLLDHVDRLIGNGETLVVLDLANVARVDALRLGEIAEALRHARARGADVKLLRPQPRVDRLLSVTRLRSVLDVCHCEEDVFLARGRALHAPATAPSIGRPLFTARPVLERASGPAG